MNSVSTVSLVTRDTPPATRDTASVSMDVASVVTRDTSSIHSRDSSAEEEEADIEVDEDHPVDLTCVPPAPLCSPADQGTMSDMLKMQWGSHKKLVGIRFLFPPLDEQMSLLEKAKIWVARHDCKYFVDWTESELEAVDPILRPLSVITRDVYKLHMNRSEYCRNVKLKYCLQSDTPWAQQFRENLARSPSEGGFTGLCQAKIAAAELWRKYSEHYRSHQARHPSLQSYDAKSVVLKTLDADFRTEHETSGSCCDALCADSDAMSDDCNGDVDGKTANQDGQRGSLRNAAVEETNDSCSAAVLIEDEADEIQKMSQGTKDISTMNLLKRQMESYIEELKSKKTRSEISQELESRNSSDLEEKASGNFRHPLRSSEFSDIINLTKRDTNDLESRRSTSVKQVSASNREARIKTEASHEAEVKSEPRLPATANALPYWNMSRLGPLMLPMAAAAYYANPMNCFLDSSLSSPAMHHHIYPFASASPNFAPSVAAARVGSVASTVRHKKLPKVRGSTNRNELSTEYRRSERGLSFLFPSFSDHNMSLMDKVNITITRHKNNYFLGWDEDALSKLDPLVRPKMVVTTEIYKEYCHRNAMKYDSNLQFAMESTEPWAKEFHEKLSLPASEGGFTSLCEVKLEAGRLWREYSGKYRMHNIVKWQMDLNSNAVPATPVTIGGTSFDGKSIKLPFRKTPRRQRYKDQRTMLLNADLGSRQNGCHSNTQNRHYEQLSKASECRSPLVGSFSERAVERVSSRCEHPTGEACRISRSLDNSPSIGGSSDGSTSNASMVGYASCSPVTEKFPRVTSTPHQAESADGFLFAPLPRQMPVADQLFVWLERNRNNYFLGFPEESLSTLHTYLRPQMVVTRDVFRRHIPESMVDVLRKIKWMMSSSEEWAVKFCDRVCKSQNDGGFATFEEALTEAVVLWHVNKGKEIHQTASSNEPKNVVADSNEGDCRTSLRQLYENKELSSKFTTGVQSELTETFLSSNKRGITSWDMNKNESDGLVKPRSLLIDENSTQWKDKSTITSDRTPSPFQNPSSGFNPESVIRLLWNLRHTLSVLCEDNPVESWEQRLVPYLPVLKRAIGSSYTAPVSSSSCMVDLILAALHQRMEETCSYS